MTQYNNQPYQDDDLISLSEIFAILFRGKWWIVGCTLLFAISALVYLLVVTPVYSAKAVIQLKNDTYKTVILDGKETAVPEEVNTTAALETIRGNVFLKKVADEGKLDLATQQLSVSEQGKNTNVISIIISGPEKARNVAALDTLLVTFGQQQDIQLLSSAASGSSPIKPKKSLILVLGVMLGGMVGVVLVFVREMLRQGFRTAEELEAKTGLSVLATISNGDDEGLRVLRTNLLYQLSNAGNNRVVICSPSDSSASHQLIPGLAKLLASASKKTLLIDADLRLGSLYKAFDMSGDAGLGKVLSASATPLPINEKLDVIAGGQELSASSEILLSKEFDQILETASSNYDAVIINVPPVLKATEAAIVGAKCSTGLMVVKADNTTNKEMEAAKQRLELAGATLTGCVFVK